MQVTYKMDNPFERLQAVGARGVFVTQDFLEHLNAVYNAVVVVGQGILVGVLGAETIALLIKPRSILGNVHKMPVVAFVTLFSYLIGPSGNRREAVITEQKLQVLLGGRRQ